MKKIDLIYSVSTYLLVTIMIVAAGWYFACYEDLVVYFNRYGYPTYLIYPLAVAKITGSIVIIYNKNEFLKELAYAGFFFNFILAFFAHYMISEFDPFPTICIVLLMVSYFSKRKISNLNHTKKPVKF